MLTEEMDHGIVRGAKVACDSDDSAGARLRDA